MKLRSKLMADYYLGGTVHVLLKPLVFVVGKISGRKHSLDGINDITIIKMIGGGSLVIAYPSLVALKSRFPNLKLKLVTTPSIMPFARILGIFDEILVVRDDSVYHMVLDSARIIRRLWLTRALIDLEIHSRFSSIFCLLTCAIDRIGIYTDLSFWRRSLYTHLLFYNKYSPIYSLYDQVVSLLDVSSIDFAQAKMRFKLSLEQSPKVPMPRALNIGVAPGCSDLSKERMLDVNQWTELLTGRASIGELPVFHFLGGPRDRSLAEQIIAKLTSHFPTLVCHNHCGTYSLPESISLISQLDFLYCIDSSLIHFARLSGVRTISYWGPTDPRIMLRPDPDLKEEAHYVKLSCSPCIHIAFEPPCYGRNICMGASLCGENYRGERNPVWLAQPIHPVKRDDA